MPAHEQQAQSFADNDTNEPPDNAQPANNPCTTHPHALPGGGGPRIEMGDRAMSGAPKAAATNDLKLWSVLNEIADERANQDA